MTKPQDEKRGTVQVMMCPSCDLIHFVIADENGNVQFSAPITDHQLDIMFIEVTSLQKQRKSANRLKPHG